MRKILKYNPVNMNSWEQYETRVYNILDKIPIDELKDLLVYRGCVIDGKNKRALIKQFMVSMGTLLTNKHFTNLGGK
jgi:hypothetical protein